MITVVETIAITIAVAAFMLGAIVSATDPVAVVAALQSLGAPPKLSHLIEGESLLNGELVAC